MAALLHAVLAALSGQRQAAAESAGGACRDASGCSFNGACVAGSCVCSAAWGGADCGELQLMPTPKDAGYAPADGGSSWGGIAVQDPANRSAWTLVASEFVNGCGLNDWSPNSRVIKAVSTTTSPLGPYAYHSELLPPFHHLLKDPFKELLLKDHSKELLFPPSIMTL